MSAGASGASVYATHCGYIVTCAATETDAVSAFTKNFAECCACHKPVEMIDARSQAAK